jgi:hypothetical protein
LILANAPGHDRRSCVILTADRRPRQPAQHRDLPDVPQRVGDRSLKDLLGGNVQTLAASKAPVEPLEGSEKPRYLLVPRQRDGVVPLLLPRAIESAQSSRSPIWARIRTGVRDPGATGYAAK